MKDEEYQKLLTKIKSELIETAQESFNDAALSGLCMEGAIEAAIGAMRDKYITINNLRLK